MATNGKLEAQITVPAGGWTMTLTDDLGGPTACTIAAGTYYHSSVGDGANDLPAAIAAAANASMGETWTCTIAAGESGTGKYTIGCSGATCTVTFTDTDERDAMGFTGNLSASTSYTSPDSAEGIWLPERPFNNLNGGGSWVGSWETDKMGGETASGHFYGVMGAKKRISFLDWNGESRAKTWVTAEVTTNESFEQFYLDCICGEASWGTVGGPLRFYPDAATDGTYASYYVPGMETWAPEQVRPGWVHLWRIKIPRLVEVPT